MKTLSDRIAREAILAELYISFSKGDRGMDVNHLCNQLEKTNNEIAELLSDLQNVGLIVAVTDDSDRILPNGVLYTESNKLAPEEMVVEQRAIRASILDQLAARHEASVLSPGMPVQALADAIEKNVNMVVNNVEVLNELELIVPYLIDRFRITVSGLLDAQNRRNRGAAKN